jgi:hypothetical protein
MTDIELSWLAGLLEGEGCFYLTTRHNKDGTPRPLVSIILSMTDEDVVRRAHKLVVSGNVHARTYADGKRKPAWVWNDSNVDTVVPLLHSLHPLMGTRRAEKIALMLAAVDGWTRRYVRGHGHRTMYMKGCRCAFCRQANTEYCADWRKRRSTVG